MFQVEPKALQHKLTEPVQLLGQDRFADVDVRIRVKGGGRIAQVYAIRQALSKALVAYYQKCKFSKFFLRFNRLHRDVSLYQN